MAERAAFRLRLRSRPGAGCQTIPHRSLSLKTRLTTPASAASMAVLIHFTERLFCEAATTERG